MLTEEMVLWLTTNHGSYEFYLLHTLFHDKLHRAKKMSVLGPEDFEFDAHVLTYRALQNAVTLGRQVGVDLPTPPSLLEMIGHVASAEKELKSLSLDPGVAKDASVIIANLMNPTFREHWYLVDPYFSDWLTSGRAKKYARKAAIASLVNTTDLVSVMQQDKAKASAAAAGDDNDAMEKMMSDENEEMVERRSTGNSALDDCFGGGWCPGDCYLIFSGTGGGKTICVCQCAWHEANTGGHVLIISTEVAECKYVGRIVSNACSIYIGDIKDCANFAQLRSIVSRKYPEKLDQLNHVLRVIYERIRIVRIDSDEGLQVRAVMERETAIFESKKGRKPTLGFVDWLGTMADVNQTGKGSSDRIVAWELSAAGAVKYAADSNIPWAILAQAVNDAQLKGTLGLSDIGIAKGIGKNMVVVVGITNTLDVAALKAAVLEGGDAPVGMTKDDQYYCVAKAREGEGTIIPVRRQFGYQRFVARQRR